jgi:hypothetical protein
MSIDDGAVRAVAHEDMPVPERLQDGITFEGVSFAYPATRTPRWRVPGLFRFELKAKQTVGVGDSPRIDDEPAVVAAVDRAGAQDVVERLLAGLETQLGPSWPEGVEVSFGQWQKLSLARGFMRDSVMHDVALLTCSNGRRSIPPPTCPTSFTGTTGRPQAGNGSSSLLPILANRLRHHRPARTPATWETHCRY